MFGPELSVWLIIASILVVLALAGIIYAISRGLARRREARKGKRPASDGQP